jgi:ribose-phosphate pyrophosphokinase
MISKMTVNGVDETHKMKLWKFPAGEVGVKLENIKIDRTSIVTFDVEYQNSDDIMYMLNLYDALQHKCAEFQGCYFYIPYLPYSRQDRVCHEGESFALNVFGQVLGLMPLANFFVDDLHSHVSKQVVPNLVEAPQYAFTSRLLVKDFDFFIAPDKGAASKISNLQGDNKDGIEQVVTLNKVRKDGKVIYEDYKFDTLYGKVCVVDDLADGGATFIALGEMLKRTQPNITSYALYVTHGLFTKGLSELESVYSEFYVGNLVNKELLSNPKVKVI